MSLLLRLVCSDFDAWDFWLICPCTERLLVPPPKASKQILNLSNPLHLISRVNCHGPASPQGLPHPRRYLQKWYKAPRQTLWIVPASSQADTSHRNFRKRSGGEERPGESSEKAYFEKGTLRTQAEIHTSSQKGSTATYKKTIYHGDHSRGWTSVACSDWLNVSDFTSQATKIPSRSITITHCNPRCKH